MNGERESPTQAELHYVQYTHDKEAIYLSGIRELISQDLSEPYSIYVYRYFLGQWGDLCFMVSSEQPGSIIANLLRISGFGPQRESSGRGHLQIRAA